MEDWVQKHLRSSRWERRELLDPSLQFTVEWCMGGMAGYRKDMEEVGWVFVQRTNLLTSRSDVQAVSKEFTAAGTLEYGNLILLNLCNTRYGRRMNREYLQINKDHPIAFSELDTTTLLKAIAAEQERVAPPKPKKSHVIPLAKHA